MSENTKPDGGPAFPCIEPTMTGISSDGEERYENEAHGGMTLRDYFAAKAPLDVADANDLFYRENGRNPRHSEMLMVLATLRYSYADAMIAARRKA
jgi:hypothetical protein